MLLQSGSLSNNLSHDFASKSHIKMIEEEADVTKDFRLKLPSVNILV